MYIPIIYQDSDIIVVNKPVGLNTHPAESNDPALADVVTNLKAQIGLNYLGIHHRLDREVSGALAFAVRKEANAGLARVFENRIAEKEYLAIVAGRLPKAKGTITAPLVEVKSGFYAVSRNPHERKAIAATTHYQVEQTALDGSWSLVRLQLETGRTHQLRVHLAYLGTPIIGDILYDQTQKFPRLLLHAATLRFPHPITETLVSFEAPSPPIFARARARQPLPELAFVQRALPNQTVFVSRDEAAISSLLQTAVFRRAPFADDPQHATTAYRLINGSSDGFPDLYVDCYGSVLAVSNLQHKSENWQKFLQKNFVDYTLVDSAAKDLTSTTFAEDNIRFELAPHNFRTDLREMRERLRVWAKGQRVLNCWAGSSQFAVAALSGGASEVVSLAETQETATIEQQTCQLNDFSATQSNFIIGNVLSELRRLAKKPEKFDIVIINSIVSGNTNYIQLANLAGQLLAPKGHLLVISDDSRMERRALRQQLTQGLKEAGINATNAALYHEPELDFPDSEKLKIFWFSCP